MSIPRLRNATAYGVRANCAVAALVRSLRRPALSSPSGGTTSSPARPESRTRRVSKRNAIRSPPPSDPAGGVGEDEAPLLAEPLHQVTKALQVSQRLLDRDHVEARDDLGDAVEWRGRRESADRPAWSARGRRCRRTRGCSSVPIMMLRPSWRVGSVSSCSETRRMSSSTSCGGGVRIVGTVGRAAASAAVGFAVLVDDLLAMTTGYSRSRTRPAWPFADVGAPNTTTGCGPPPGSDRLGSAPGRDRDRRQVDGDPVDRRPRSDEGAGSDEGPLPDGRGRCRDFERGSIYWTRRLVRTRSTAPSVWGGTRLGARASSVIR